MRGMSISADIRDPRVADVRVTDTALIVRLRDGREIRAPFGWFPRLQSATEDERSVWEVSAAGHGIHWPSIDEDLSIAGLLYGQPARE